MKTESSPFIIKKKIFPASFESLREIGDFVYLASEAAKFSSTESYSIQLAVDEACSNIIEHAYKSFRGIGEIECTCSVDDHGLTIILHDFGEPFDPSGVPVPDTNADLEDRMKGGLGLYFIRELMDEVTFHFDTGEYVNPLGPFGNFLIMKKYKERFA